ncbi:MAG: Elongation factor Ts [candidate division CPR2 bacterium GW2011_GWC1_39_9]|uniref:Elongation factor Ts n=1 Tax=candidate division CPR2 bacterium GW2011_GWC2_39_10 TaxID=1618345 RepID=A0A0G0LTK0_UNCC2|nr:MAG: Elongation factor Ts [candidate division CPR2 bacterium GW2011_GWC2_39_10]KKR33187.1 MAG: Elongation factor Ts [candidate division CPR2 bacterium GW2011_GWC1_39_9]
MPISAKDVQKLRMLTGAPMMDAKKALEETSGDFEKAKDVLRKKGQAKAAKKAERETREGIIGSYIHGDKIGVLIEVNSETDFVARNDNFKDFVHNVAMHIAAACPTYLVREDVPKDVLDKEKEIFTEQLKDQNKPAEILEKIINGKIEKFYLENVLMDQLYVRDDSKTINDLTTEVIAKLGENVQIRRFTRYQIGD